MSRCKACNKQFSDSEELAQHTTPCDIQMHREECSKCYRLAMQAAHGNDWEGDPSEGTDLLAEAGFSPMGFEFPDVDNYDGVTIH